MFEIDGFRCVLKNKSGHRLGISSAASLIIDPDNYAYCKKIISYLEKSENGKRFKIGVYSGITSEKNTALFDVLSAKLLMHPFAVKFNDMGKKIASNREKFISFGLLDQILALKSILELLKTGRSSGCDLTAIGESKQSGILRFNMDLSTLKDTDSLYIIDQSPTGLFEKKSPNLLEL